MNYYISVCNDTDLADSFYPVIEGVKKEPVNCITVSKVNDYYIDEDITKLYRNKSNKATIAVLGIEPENEVDLYTGIFLFGVDDYSGAKNAAEQFGINLPENPSFLPTIAGIKIS